MQLGLEPQDALSFWVWAARLWPFVLLLGALLLFRSKIEKRFPFFVLGSLLCFGVQLIVGQIAAGLPTDIPVEAPFPEKMLQALLATLSRTILISLVLSVAPLWWLYRLLR